MLSAQPPPTFDWLHFMQEHGSILTLLNGIKEEDLPALKDEIAACTAAIRACPNCTPRATGAQAPKPRTDYSGILGFFLVNAKQIGTVVLILAMMMWQGITSCQQRGQIITQTSISAKAEEATAKATKAATDAQNAANGILEAIKAQGTTAKTDRDIVTAEKAAAPCAVPAKTANK